MNLETLRGEVERLWAIAEPPREPARVVVERLLDALESGALRAAERRSDGSWAARIWVKRGILLGFRVAQDIESGVPPHFHFRDRDLFAPVDAPRKFEQVRIVPGGTTIRRGAFLSPGTIVMPPAFVNLGAWIGAGTMIDSHALVGSCAQIGARVHLSAAAQIGGVLEPVGAVPVIVEDDVFVGGGCGVYEGTRVRAGAILAAGVILTRSVPVFDLVRGEVLRAEPNAPLTIPENAVVVPGARAAGGEFAARNGVMLQTPVIVKYRDLRSDAASELEGALR